MLLYAAGGIAWILFSDAGLAIFVREPARRPDLQTGKAVAFVVVSALVLYVLMRRNLSERTVREVEVRTVLEAMADAVVVTDRSGQVVDVNAAAVVLYGAAHRRELLRPMPELLARVSLPVGDGQAPSWEESATARALRGEIVTGHETRMRAFDGAERYLAISSAPVRAHPREAPRLAVAVIRDISEVKRFEEMREEFLATAAHEFKTPLAVVKAYAQLMRKRGQGDGPGLDVIARQIDRMARMVGQLLEVSRFRLGSGDLRREWLDLAALLEEVLGTLRSQAAGRRITFTAKAQAQVLADRQRIQAVVVNLVENALRFSPEGEVVEAALTRGDSEAIVSVRDHGVGIPQERQARVFERYYRAHAGTAEDYGGLGVGLDVSREIVARHGGRIWFESAPGAGSTFSFSIPLAKGPS